MFKAYHKLYYRLLYSISLIIVCILIGILGYVGLEGYDTLDAFYMTMITISTVGFGEVQSLSPHGKIFTSLLIIMSLGTFAYAITSLSSYLFGGDFRKLRKAIMEKRKIDALKNHVVICGFGRVGRQVAEDFARTNQSFVVVELDPARVVKYEEDENYNFVVGDATVDENLVNANLENAKAIITCMPSDANNVYVVLAAREMNKNIQIIARASKNETYNKLKIAGANSVIMPDSVGGSHMASLVVRPDVMEFIDEIIISSDYTPNIVAINYKNLPLKFKDQKLQVFKDAEISGCSVVGIKEQDGDYQINPSGNTLITEGCKILMLGDKEQIDNLRKYFEFDA
ncbi:voltage-gated potassium channel [Lishizhenia tianjinensis]|uniref:Voltage-gated potassium channel n=1 Tax=Lishizhenia tianjinensis TaxID=477690 RepID=A0A1I7BM51_9FLAO|nr:voltage-gated potassium channel [Lishizhenia tianjinensis]